jgi:non-heme chloroperoxidase
MTVYSSILKKVARQSFVVLATLFFGFSIALAAEQQALQLTFDSLGPTVQQLQSDNGRNIHFIDDGNEGGTPVVFTGGLGTSVRVVRLLDFLESMRRDLNLRFITVERNGFGQTAFDETLTMADYVAEVEQVLEHLNIEKFAVFGISGGGPYTAKIAESNADRLLSIHMAATSPAIGNLQRCSGNAPSPWAEMLRYPMQFFGFPEESPLHRIEGFQATAFDEAARAHNLRGQSADPAPLLHELNLYCTEAVMDSAHITTPVFVYLGLKDEVLGSVNPDAWIAAYPNSDVQVRTYPNGGHDVQYRHLDQILLDMSGAGDKILICEDGIDQMVLPESIEGKNPDSLGLCIWQN